jgi:hypothetical protein
MKNEILKTLENLIIDHIGQMSFKPFLEENEEISDAYDSRIITHEDFRNLKQDIINKIKKD